MERVTEKSRVGRFLARRGLALLTYDKLESFQAGNSKAARRAPSRIRCNRADVGDEELWAPSAQRRLAVPVLTLLAGLPAHYVLHAAVDES
jgi:hypothetical protein